jgi:ubiquinol-cytochrome c reductase cytochrome b subunit
VSARAWLSERLGRADRATASVRGGPSWAYALGWAIVALLLVQALTGAALAAFYAPTVTDAWASVAYVQDQMPGGWLVRGLHHHGASAIVIVAGLHLVQTALFGAYRRPRELVWWIGILLLLLVFAFAITGFVLRWDQAGYWANKVEVGIVAGTPVVGGAIERLLLGGNDYGNLTLTRFYALHVVVLPGLFLLAAFGHVVLARRHGATPRRDRRGATPIPRWPRQTARDVIAMAAAFSALLAYSFVAGGADLMAPADPSQAYDARPLWYFRWLFELRELAGAAELVAALTTPALGAGLLLALPVLDRQPELYPRRRRIWLGVFAGMVTTIVGLTVASFARDASDDALTERRHAAAQRASRARALAVANGVPATGAQDVFTTVPMYRARTLYAQYCQSCHAADSPDREGPIIAPGHGDRGWLRGFLAAPSSDPYWGKTKLAKTENAMAPVELPDAELDDLVELLYAESGATDVDAGKVARGKAAFESACTDCHSLAEGVASDSGPGLARLGSRDWYTSVIGNPTSPVHMGDFAEMPRFDRELTIVDRDLIAGFLVWLRTATPADLAALGPL